MLHCRETQHRNEDRISRSMDPDIKEYKKRVDEICPKSSREPGSKHYDEGVAEEYRQHSYEIEHMEKEKKRQIVAVRSIFTSHHPGSDYRK